MTDLRPQIAVQIRLAQHRHAQTYPAGDWHAANRDLGHWRLLAVDVDPRTSGMGNDMCVAHLEAEFAA
jgi:hypothetical protein